jgi:hypothetical protein
MENIRGGGHAPHFSNFLKENAIYQKDTLNT